MILSWFPDESQALMALPPYQQNIVPGVEKIQAIRSFMINYVDCVIVSDSVLILQ